MCAPTAVGEPLSGNRWQRTGDWPCMVSKHAHTTLHACSHAALACTQEPDWKAGHRFMPSRCHCWGGPGSLPTQAVLSLGSGISYFASWCFFEHPHGQNGDNNSTSITGLMWRFKNLICAKHLEKFSENSKHSINWSCYYYQLSSWMPLGPSPWNPQDSASFFLKHKIPIFIALLNGSGRK